ncbi:MAG: hypothetical protein ACJA0N_002632, partial [Pseudohongiellaceae bacterium]
MEDKDLLTFALYEVIGFSFILIAVLIYVIKKLKNTINDQKAVIRENIDVFAFLNREIKETGKLIVDVDKVTSKKYNLRGLRFRNAFLSIECQNLVSNGNNSSKIKPISIAMMRLLKIDQGNIKEDTGKSPLDIESILDDLNRKIDEQKETIAELNIILSGDAH